MNVLLVEDGAKDANSVRKQLMSLASSVKITHVGTWDEARSHLASGAQCDLVLAESKLSEDAPSRECRQSEKPHGDCQGSDPEIQKREVMGMLSTGVAHNLNNALAGVAGYMELAREDLPSDSPVQAHLEMIERAIQSGSELCRQMLAYSGDEAMGRGQFDLNQLVQENSRLIDISTNHGTILSWELAESLPAVIGESERLKQVLFSLLLNAAGAIGEDQGHITIRTGTMEVDGELLAQTESTSELDAGTHVFLEVQDSGPSIPEDKRDAVFNRAYASQVLGRRLSLATVRDTVISLGGALSFTSESGRGSTFRVILPRAD